MPMASSQIGPTVVPLPTPEQVRAEVQEMVDFGPRLTGYPGHDEFCTWVEDEMRAAGFETAGRARQWSIPGDVGPDRAARELRRADASNRRHPTAVNPRG
jgi:hypothetical protein